MEYKKKKNDERGSRRVMAALIAFFFGYLFLLGCGLWTNLPFYGGEEAAFNQTATSIVATNDAVATLIQQTQIAVTEQFIMTSTARP